MQNIDFRHIQISSSSEGNSDRVETPISSIAIQSSFVTRSTFGAVHWFTSSLECHAQLEEVSLDDFLSKLILVDRLVLVTAMEFIWIPLFVPIIGVTICNSYLIISTALMIKRHKRQSEEIFGGFDKFYEEDIRW